METLPFSTQMNSKISLVIVMIIRQKEKRAQQKDQEANRPGLRARNITSTHIPPETTLSQTNI